MSSSQSEERTMFLAPGKKSCVHFIGAIVFCLYSNLPAIYFTQIHSFSIVHSEQNVNINSWITSYPYPHYNFYHTSLLVYLVFFIISRCVAVTFSILAFEKDLTSLKQKADKKMSGYVYDKHNTTYKALCAVFTQPMPLHQKSHSIVRCAHLFHFGFNNSLPS